MSLTAERAQILGDYLASDTERAKRLVELPAEEAVKRINADGHDFTVEELRDFAEAANKVAEMQAKDGELSEEELGEVAGGSILGGISKLIPFIPRIWGPIRPRW